MSLKLQEEAVLSEGSFCGFRKLRVLVFGFRVELGCTPMLHVLQCRVFFIISLALSLSLSLSLSVCVEGEVGQERPCYSLSPKTLNINLPR